MKKILSVSNSFGVDATRYLYGVARSEGELLPRRLARKCKLWKRTLTK